MKMLAELLARVRAWYWYRRAGARLAPARFRFEALVERIARAGGGWHEYTSNGAIACADGYCILGALARWADIRVGQRPSPATLADALRARFGVTYAEAQRYVNINDRRDSRPADRAYLERRLGVEPFAAWRQRTQARAA